MRDSFSACHPFVNLVYFAAVLTFGMLFMHPAFQIAALLGASVYAVLLRGKAALKFLLRYMLPLLLAMAVFNPAFNHAGVTILFYLNNGNPITLESIWYGIASACMFVTALIWFTCFNVVMTSDKLIYLFGKIWPALSLLLSMALRFVPRYAEQLKRITRAQRSIGRDVTQGNAAARARNGMKIVSILTTWALENAVETADSMKARGYGLPGRTSFSLYRFDGRDRAALIVMTALIGIVLAGAAMGDNTIRFFPSVKMKEATPVSFVVYAAYLVLCMLPVSMNLAEEWKWKSMRSGR
jgi:ABC-type cobalt transport system, permease component CbiQ and related transporters